MLRLRKKTPFTGHPNTGGGGLGTHSRAKVANNGDFVAQAGIPSGIPNANIGDIPTYIDTNPLLTNLTDFVGDTTFSKLYTDMYFYDVIAGSAVDLISSLPFSDFTLGGISDRKISDLYMETIERLNIKTLLAELSVDYLVLGTFCGSLLYDKTTRKFVDLMPHNIGNIKVTPLPFYSQDPILEITFPAQLREVLTRKSTRLDNIKNRLGAEVVAKLLSGTLELDPLSTIYIPRKTFATSEGTSYFKRILPIYLIEKNLYRGTIVESSRRQRGIMHIVLGDGDAWEPTPEDMEFVTDLFQTADCDPLGAIVATRSGISINEVRCFAGDTLVPTEFGLERIDSLHGCAHSMIFAPETTVPVSFCAKGVRGEFVKIAQWHYRGIAPTVTLTTDSGYSITTTPEHKVLALLPTGVVKLLSVENLQANGALVCVETNGVVHPNTVSQLPLNLTVTSNGNGHHCTVKVPQTLTPDLAFLMGLVLGDGYVSRKGVHFSNTDWRLVQYFDQLCARVFGVSASVSSRNPATMDIMGRTCATRKFWTSSANSIHMASMFQQLGFVLASDVDSSSPCLEYTVPCTIMQADPASQYAFLAGFIEADGSVTLDKSRSTEVVSIGLYSGSVVLLEAAQIMLANLGYFSKFYTSIDRRTTPNTVCYRLIVETSEAGRLYNNLLPYLVSKKPCAGILPAKRYKYGIPAFVFAPLLRSRFVRRNPTGGNWYVNDAGDTVLVTTPCGVASLFRHFYYGDSYMLYDEHDLGAYAEHLRVIDQISPCLHAKLQRLLRARYHFQAVVSVVSAGTQPVYDLSVDQTVEQPQIFVANGLVVKNSPQEFWQVNQFWDSVTQYKLKALGLSEDLLSQGASFQTTDAAMSVFVESLRSYRDMITRKLFYNKIFPLLSLINGYTINTNGKIKKQDNLLQQTVDENLFTLQDGSKLLIPQVHWAKQLKPEGDTQYVDLLDRMTAAGIPVPLRIMAAAGGFNLDDLLVQQEDDLGVRTSMLEYNKRIKEIKKQFGGGEEGEEGEKGGGMDGFASDSQLLPLLSESPGGKTRSAVHSRVGKPAFFRSTSATTAEPVYERTKTGKPKHVRNGRERDHATNVQIARALTEQQRKRSPLTTTTVTPHAER